MSCVGFDVRGTEPGFKAHFGRGTGRYVSELRSAMGELLTEDSDLRVRFLGSDDLHGSGYFAKAFSALPLGKQTVMGQAVVPFRSRQAGIDLIHFPSHADAPALPFLPTVVTVLDLIPLRFPELYKAKKSNLRFRFARFLEFQAVKSASLVLAISEATKRDVVQLLGVSPDKVVVTPLGISKDILSQEPRTQQTIAGARKELGYPENQPLLLYVGGIDPRKNILFLLETFSALLQNQSEPRPKLVLVGNYTTDDHYPLLLKRIKELGLEDFVDLRGFVSDEQLPLMYQSADLFIFPSLYEGFGLPVLEAMAYGVPVVAGNNSSIPEVVGDAGILLADNDIALWSSQISRLLSAREPLKRLASLGPLAARQFSWQETARKTLEAYRSVLAS